MRSHRDRDPHNGERDTGTKSAVCIQQESLPLSLTHRKTKIKRQTRHTETHSKTDREAHTQTHKYGDKAAHRDTGSGTHRKRHVLIGR